MSDTLYIKGVWATHIDENGYLPGTNFSIKVDYKEGILNLSDDNKNGVMYLRVANALSSKKRWTYYTLEDVFNIFGGRIGERFTSIDLQNNQFYDIELWAEDPDGVWDEVHEKMLGTKAVVRKVLVKTGDRIAGGEIYNPSGDTTIEYEAPDTNTHTATEVYITTHSNRQYGSAVLWHIDWDVILADLKSKGVSADMIYNASLNFYVYYASSAYGDFGKIDVYKKTSREYDTTVETYNTCVAEDGSYGQLLTNIYNDYQTLEHPSWQELDLPDLVETLKTEFGNENFIYDLRLDNAQKYQAINIKSLDAADNYIPYIKIYYDNAYVDGKTTMGALPEIGSFNSSTTPETIDVIWALENGDLNSNAKASLRYRQIVNGTGGEWSEPIVLNTNRVDGYNLVGNSENGRVIGKSTDLNGANVVKVIKYNLSQLPDFDPYLEWEFELTVIDNDESYDSLIARDPNNGYKLTPAESVVGSAFYPSGQYWYTQPVNESNPLYKSTQAEGNPNGYFICSDYVDGVISTEKVKMWEYNNIGEFLAYVIRDQNDGWNVDGPWIDDDTGYDDSLNEVDEKQITNINPILNAVGNTCPVIVTYENDMGTGNTPATMAIAYKKTTVGWSASPTYISLKRDNANKRFIGNLSNLAFEETYDARIKIVDADGIDGTEDTTAYVDSSFSTTAVEANLILGSETITPGVWNIAVEIPFTNPVGSNPALYNYSAAIQWKKTVDNKYGSSIPMLLTQINNVSGTFKYNITELIDNSEYDVKITFTNTLGIDGTNPLIITNILTLPYDQLTPTLTEPNGTEDIDGEFEITWTLNGDDVVPTSEQRTEIQVYDGLKYPWYVQDNEWKNITITAAGEESYTYNFGQLLSTEVARVRIRTISVKSGITYKSEWDYSDQVFQIINNTPPDAPTDLTPDNTWEDLANIILFSWKHNGRTTQTKAKLYWQDRANPGYTKIDITGKNYYYVMPANTLPDSDIQWYIKTYCMVNGVETVSPSSYVAQFRASELSTSPVITYPAENDLIGIANILATWTVDDQIAFQCRLYDNTTDTEVYNSGELVSTVKNHSILYDLEHGHNYTVFVKTQNSSENWSAEDDNTFDVSFVAPEKPVITVYPNSTDYAIEISCDNPVGGIEVDRNDLWRFDNESETAILIASDMGSYYEDNSVAGSVRYYYFVQTWGTNGTYIYSDIKSTEISIEGCELRDSVDTGLFVRFEAYPTESSVDFGNGTSLTKFQGREYPVSSTGTMSDKVYSLGLDVFTLANRNKVKQMFKDKNHLLYRDDKQNRDYVMILKYNETPYNEADQWFKIDLTIAKVDHNEGTVIDNIRHLPIDNISEALRG